MTVTGHMTYDCECEWSCDTCLCVVSCDNNSNQAVPASYCVLSVILMICAETVHHLISGTKNVVHDYTLINYNINSQNKVSGFMVCPAIFH